MEQSHLSLLDHLALFNTSMGVVALRGMYDRNIIADEDIAPVRASLALLVEATEAARGTVIGSTFAEMIEEITRILPLANPGSSPSDGMIADAGPQL